MSSIELTLVDVRHVLGKQRPHDTATFCAQYDEHTEMALLFEFDQHFVVVLQSDMKRGAMEYFGPCGMRIKRRGKPIENVRVLYELTEQTLVDSTATRRRVKFYDAETDKLLPVGEMNAISLSAVAFKLPLNASVRGDHASSRGR